MTVHPDDERLNTICARADKNRPKKPRQHYVNFPLDQTDVETQGCGDVDKCIFKSLRDNALRMADNGRFDTKRAKSDSLAGPLH